MTLSDFEGLTWSDFLPHSQLGESQQFYLDYNTLGSSSQSADSPTLNGMLTKFRHATDLRNPNRIPMADFGYYMVDEVDNLTKLAQQGNWSQMDLLHFHW